MSPRDLMLNFVSLYKKPFSAEIAASLTGLSRSDTESIIQELLQNQTIKQISQSESIYVKNQRYNAVVGYNQKGSWRFDPSAASALLDFIEKQSYNSIRKIAADFGKSRQWVFVYIEALASIGIVGVKGDAYYVITRANLNKLGSYIKAGIIGDLRSIFGENRQQMAKDKKAKYDQEVKERREKAWSERKIRMEARQLAEQEKQRKKAEALLRRKNNYIIYLNKG